MSELCWEAKLILSQRADGWSWEKIREYFLLLDNIRGFNIARRMQFDQSKPKS